jgi:Ca2+-transporting ATPase
MIIFVGGVAFSVTRLNGTQWAISVVLGFFSLPVGVFIRLIPDKLVRRCIPAFFERKRSPVVMSDEDYQWNQGLIEIRDELAFIKSVCAGRPRNLKLMVLHLKEILAKSLSSLSLSVTPSSSQRYDCARPPTSFTSSRRHSEVSPTNLASVMPGIVAGSIAGCYRNDRDCSSNDLIRHVVPFEQV